MSSPRILFSADTMARFNIKHLSPRLVFELCDCCIKDVCGDSNGLHTDSMAPSLHIFQSL